MAVMLKQTMLAILLMFSSQETMPSFFHPAYTHESVLAATEKTKTLEDNWSEITSEKAPGSIRFCFFKDAYSMDIKVLGEDKYLRFWAVPFKLGSNLYLDLVPFPPGLKNGFKGIQVAPVHYLCRMAIDKDSLTLWFLDHIRLAQVLEEKPSLLSHEKTNSVPDTLTVIITAKTLHIQNFIQSEECQSLFMDKVVFKRD